MVIQQRFSIIMASTWVKLNIELLSLLPYRAAARDRAWRGLQNDIVQWSNS